MEAKRRTADNGERARPWRGPVRRGPVERLAAWLRLGPLGHLWSTGVELVVYVARRVAERIA